MAYLQSTLNLIPWPYWFLIGLAAGFFLLLVWSWLVSAKQGDEDVTHETWHNRRNGHQ